MQPFIPGAGHLTEMLAIPRVDAEVCPDVSCAYCAHAGAIFPAHECVQGLDVINPQY